MLSVVRRSQLAVLAAAAAVAAFGVGVWVTRVGAGYPGAAAPAIVLVLGLLPIVCVWAWRDPRVGVALVFVTLPLPFGAPIGRLHLQPVELAIGFAVVVTVAARLSARSPLRVPTAAIWLLALVVWAVVDTALAAKVPTAVKGTISLVEGVILVLVGYNVVRSLADLRWLLGVAVAVAAVVALPTVWTLPQMTVKYGGANVEGRAAGLFQGVPALQQFEVHLGPNQFGAYMSVALFAALALAIGARTPRRRLLAAAAMLPIAAALVASLSRGAWIGAAVGAVFVFAFAPPARRVLGRIAIVAVLLAAAVVVVDPNVGTAVGDRFDKLTVRGPYDRRPQMWTEAVDQITADPLTGSGPANYRVVAQVHGLGAFAPFHAHNIWLTWGAEMGLPAIALILAFCVAFGRAVMSHGSRRGRRTIEHAIVIALAASPLAFLIHGFVHYTSQHFELYAVLGMTLAACRLGQERPSEIVLGGDAYPSAARDTSHRPATRGQEGARDGTPSDLVGTRRR